MISVSEARTLIHNENEHFRTVKLPLLQANPLNPINHGSDKRRSSDNTISDKLKTKKSKI